MTFQRLYHPSSSSLPIQQNTSLFAPRPFAVPDSQHWDQPLTQEETGENAFSQHQFEASQLKTQESHGTKTPGQQERLDVSQAKMMDVQKKPNHTGLPDRLKAGIETLSGMSMDDLKVHDHSPKPAQLHALAYTQGCDIHIGPGQGKHLAHEAWHVVQQKQGRVKPTVQTQGVSINDSRALEREADVMGAKALQMSQATPATTGPTVQSATESREAEPMVASESPGAAIGTFWEKGRLNDHSIPQRPSVRMRSAHEPSSHLLSDTVQGMFFIPIGVLEDSNIKITNEAEEEEAKIITRDVEAFYKTSTEGGKLARLTYDPNSLEKQKPHQKLFIKTTDKRVLAKLKDQEELQIGAHGGVSPGKHNVGVSPAVLYGEMSPEELAQRLVDNGLKSSYSGVIYLSGCNTAVGEGASYAARLQQSLKDKHKTNCVVKGNLGPAFIHDNYQRRVENPDRDSQTIIGSMRAKVENAEKEVKQLQGKLKDAQNSNDQNSQTDLMVDLVQANTDHLNAVKELAELIKRYSEPGDTNTASFPEQFPGYHRKEKISKEIEDLNNEKSKLSSQVKNIEKQINSTTLFNDPKELNSLTSILAALDKSIKDIDQQISNLTTDIK